jgi:hypothetical protein
MNQEEMAYSLENCIYYMKVHELREVCISLGLSETGTKVFLIKKILLFVETGKKIRDIEYPSISIYNKKNKKLLEPFENFLMLKGEYKNDLKNRNFFKKTIGLHFHYTAFGIDWLEERWICGKPPTYREFSEMWQREYLLRQKKALC